jgi:nickel/cobalt transporter (NiCoT) family protein
MTEQRVAQEISVSRLFDDRPRGAKTKIAFLYAFLLLANALSWLCAYVQFHEHPILLGTASLAYTFELRHAVDPDHIAVIDTSLAN